MSTTIDQRVVEMRFDNKQFERETRNTMSTLDRLKEKLNLTGASKGLEEVNHAVKNNNMSVLGSAVETVSTKFSAMQVIGITALANITNQAVNAGKRIASALTIDPIRSGFQEYETKMGSIQTILANTEHQGTTMDDVTAALEELNLYADKTIYNFQEMTRNIGTFTAAGVDLNTSVKAIQGIANLAAVSGSTSQQASTAMYQLSQALATGTVKLQDWNSVVNAGMGGKVFQNALIRTAAMLDGAAEDVEAWQAKNVDSYGSFRESLTQGAWLTSEVLTETLKQFTMAAEEGTEEWEAFKKSLMEQGYAEAQAEEILKMANTATDAATKVKTFTQLFDTLKESAQSGWAQTWELMFGDFEEAKEFFTTLSDSIGGFINSMSEYRNNLLGTVLDSNYDKLISKINKAGIDTAEYEEKVRSVAEAHGISSKEFDKIIAKHGKLSKAVKAGAISSNILKKALKELGISSSDSDSKLSGFIEQLEKIERLLGFGSVGDDVKTLQSALEELGYSVGKCKIDGIIGPDTTKAIKEFQEAAGIAVDGIAGPETLAALKEAGTSISEISDNVKEADLSYEDLIDNITDKGGRELFLEGFANVVESLMGVFKALGTAWSEIFPAEAIQDKILKAIELFNNFSKKLALTKEVINENGETITVLNTNGEKLMRTFKGVFAIFDIIATIVSGPFTIAFKTLKTLFSALDLDILKSSSSIADAIVKFRDWIDATLDFNKVFETIRPYVEDIADIISKWIKANIDLAGWLNVIEDRLENVKDAIVGWFEGLKNTEDISTYIIETLGSGLLKVKDFVVEKAREIGTSLYNGLCEILLMDWSAIPTDIMAGFEKGLGWGILSIIKNIRAFCIKFIETVMDIFIVRSPSRVMTGIGQNVMEGFLNGITSPLKTIFSLIKKVFTSIITFIKGILGIHSPSVVMFEMGQNMILGFVNGITSMFDLLISSIRKIFTRARDSVDEVDFSSPLDSIISKLKDFGSKIVEIFKGIDFGKILAAALGVGMLLVAKKAIDVLEMFGKPLEGLGDMLSGIGEAAEGFGKNLKASAMLKRAKALLVMSGAIAILVMAILPLTELSWGQLGKAAASLVVLAGVITALYFVLALIGNMDTKGDLKSTFKLITIAGSIFLIAFAVNSLSKIVLDGNVLQTINLLGAIIGSLAILMIAFGIFVNADKAGNMDKAGLMIFKMAAALLTITTVVKIVSGFTYSELEKGLDFILGVGLLFTAITAVSKFAGEHGDKAGAMLLKMSIAMMVMAGVVKIVSGMSEEDIAKGQKFIVGVGLLFAALTLISDASGQYSNKVGRMLVSMGISMLLMVAVIKMVAGMSTDDIKKGIGVVAAISVLFAGIVAVSYFAGEHAIKAGIMLLAMTTALLIMVGITWIVSKLDPKEMWKALGFVAALELMFAGLIFITKYSKASKYLKTTLISLIVAIGLMLAAVIALSFIDTKDLAIATASIMGIVGMFAALMLATKYTKNTKHMRRSLLMLLGVTAVLAGIIFALARLDPKSALAASGSLSALLLSFTASIMILGKAGKISKTVIDALYDMLVIAGALGILLTAMSFIPADNIPSLIASSVALGILLNAFAASMVVLGEADRISKTVTDNVYKMAIIVGALGILLSFMSRIPTENIPSLIASSVALGILLNAFAASMVVLSTAGKIDKSVTNAIYDMVVIAGALGILLTVMSFIPTENIPSLIASSVALGILLNAFAASMIVLSGAGKIDKSVTNAIYDMIVIAGALGILLSVMSFIPTENIPSLIASSVALGILLNAFASSIAILGFTKAGIVNARPALQPMILVVAELAGILGLMSALNVEASIPSAIALGILLNLLATSMVILGFVGPTASAAIPAAIAMGLVVTELAVAMGIMAKMDVESAIPYAVSLSILLIALTAAVGLLGIIAPLIPAAIPAVVGLGVVVAELAILLAALGGIAQIPGLEWLISEGGDFLQLIGEAIGQFVGGLIGGMAAGAAESLPAIGISLSMFMSTVQGFITGAQSIDKSILEKIGYLSAAILLLTAADFLAGIASFAGLSFTDLGVQLAGFMAGAMPFIIGVKMIDPATIDAAKNLAEMILILTAADLISGITSLLGFGKSNFEDLGKHLSLFGDAICTFSNKITENGGINEEAVQAASKAGTMLAELNASLPRSGGWVQDIIGEQDLEKFSIACVAFADCILGINKSVSQEGFAIESEKIDQLVTAGKQFSELNSSLPKTGGIAQDLAGEKDLAGFGAACAAFAECMITINESISSEEFVVQTDKMSQLASAGTSFNELNIALPKTGGVAQDFIGEKDLATFGAAVSAFVDCLIGVNNSLNKEGFSINLDGMTAIKDAGLQMNELQSVLPKTGGWWEEIAGEQDISDFGSKIASFASSMVTFSTKSSELNNAAVSNTIMTAYRIKMLIEDLADLDTSGLATFTGVGTGGFGADGAAYKIAQAMSAYSNKVTDINISAVTTSVSAATTLKHLIGSLVGLDTSGIENFKISTIASNIKAYADKIGDINVSAVTTSVSVAGRLKNLIAGLVGLDTSGVPSFINVIHIGTTLKAYSEKISGTNYESIDLSIVSIRKLKSLISSMAGLDTSGVGAFKNAINTLATTDVVGFANAFKDVGKFTSVGLTIVNAIRDGLILNGVVLTTTGMMLVDNMIMGITSKNISVMTAMNVMINTIVMTVNSKKETFNSLGVLLMSRFISGISSKSSAVRSAVSSMVSLAASSIRNHYGSFYNAGSYLVDGLCSGISANSYKVVNAAVSMAKAAAKAAEEALQINSPSKVFRAIGYSVPEGFAMGIDRLAYMAKTSAVSMADTAISSVKNSISRIAEAVNTDIDSQPTIRPVLDLSDVESGASAINGLFNNGASVGVLANAGTINTMMKQRNQNGVNDDLITAINKLRGDLNSVGNTYYTIDGITYSNGTEVADAITSLTRAIKMEGRV